MKKLQPDLIVQFSVVHFLGMLKNVQWLVEVEDTLLPTTVNFEHNGAHHKSAEAINF